MKGTKAAARYAQSLIGLAIERGELDQVKADMELIARICAESHELDLLLQSPIVKTDQKLKALRSIFEKAVSKLTLEFIELLTKKGRESVITGVAASFAELYNQHMGVVTAEVTSAVALSSSQVNDIVKSLADLGKNIQLFQNVDPHVLGGLKIKVGDQRVDATLRRKLNELKHETHK
jgi:F-type H+-transporting ATPase subunit delta